MRKMKESGIDWLEKIPENWDTKRLKKVLAERNEKNNPIKSKNILSLSIERGVFPYSEKTGGGNKAKEKLEDYKLAYENDIVLNSMNVVVGAVGLSKYFGCVSPVYYTLYGRNEQYNINYYSNLFQSSAFQKSLWGLGNGIVVKESDSGKLNTIRMRISMEKLNNVILPIPPKEEQEKIVKFLDKKIVEIDKVIEKTKETIEDYKKYKQSIITNAVTEGLDRNVEIKDSGIEWIGEIPKSWKTIKIKYTSCLKGRIGWQGLNSGDYKEEGAFLITGTDFKNGQIEWNTCVHISEERYQEAPEIHIKENDLLITKDGTIGKLAIVKNCPSKVSINSGILLIRNTSKFKYNKRFLYYVLHSEQFKLWYALSQTGNSTIKHLYQEQFANFVFTYPDLQLQEDIIRYLDKKCNKIDEIIYQKEKLIEELENYKRSLIYEYVTGKKEINESKFVNDRGLKQIKINCKDNIFAQAILLCKVIEKLNQYNLGRVKAEKTLYLIEKDIGFDFDNNYVREAAGPLSESIYKCESVISKKNKWIKVNKVKKHIEYEILSDFSKYSKYYQKYYSDYDDQIENIIEKVKNYSTDKSEMVATLYASWNDFLIKKEEISDLKIVKDVRENWNDTKKRFNEQKWLDVLEEMKQIELKPKGNGNLTIIKGN